MRKDSNCKLAMFFVLSFSFLLLFNAVSAQTISQDIELNSGVTGLAEYYGLPTDSSYLGAIDQTEALTDGFQLQLDQYLLDPEQLSIAFVLSGPVPDDTQYVSLDAILYLDDGPLRIWISGGDKIQLDPEKGIYSGFLSFDLPANSPEEDITQAKLVIDMVGISREIEQPQYIHGEWTFAFDLDNQTLIQASEIFPISRRLQFDKPVYQIDSLFINPLRQILTVRMFRSEQPENIGLDAANLRGFLFVGDDGSEVTFKIQSGGGSDSEMTYLCVPFADGAEEAANQFEALKNASSWKIIPYISKLDWQSDLLGLRGYYPLEEAAISIERSQAVQSRPVANTLGRFLGLAEDNSYLINLDQTRATEEGIVLHLDQALVEENRISYSMYLTGNLPENMVTFNMMGGGFSVEGTVPEPNPDKMPRYSSYGTDLFDYDEENKPILSHIAADQSYPANYFSVTFDGKLPEDRPADIQLKVDSLNIVTQEFSGEMRYYTVFGPWAFDLFVFPEQIARNQMSFELSKTFHLDQKTYTVELLWLSLPDQYIRVSMKNPVDEAEKKQRPTNRGGGGAGMDPKSRGRLVGFKLITDEGAEYDFLYSDSGLDMYGDEATLYYEGKDFSPATIQSAKTLRLIPYVTPELVLDVMTSLDEAEPLESEIITIEMDSQL